MLPILPSFGGSVLSMIITLKNNARRKRKPFELQKDRSKYIIKTHHPLKFKKVSDSKLKEVNAKLLKSIDLEDNIRLLLILALMIILGSGAIYGTMRYNNSVKEHNAKVAVNRRQYGQAIAIEENLDVEARFQYLIEEGNKWLDKERYNYAKQQLYDACILKPNNFDARLGLTTAYVYACLKYDSECHVAERILKSSIEKFGRKEQLVNLEKAFYSK